MGLFPKLFANGLEVAGDCSRICFANSPEVAEPPGSRGGRFQNLFANSREAAGDFYQNCLRTARFVVAAIAVIYVVVVAIVVAAVVVAVVVIAVAAASTAARVYVHYCELANLRTAATINFVSGMRTGLLGIYSCFAYIFHSYINTLRYSIGNAPDCILH